MSTDYSPLKKVRACDLFDGRLDEFGVREHVKPGATSKKTRLLTDGCNYLWVYINDDGFVGSFTRYFPNGDPGKILNAVAEVFDTDIVSEYEPQYWGFDTQEEMRAYEEKMSKAADEQLYIGLLNYARGEPNHLEAGMRKAQIAKALVEKDPSLLLPINKDKLLNEVRSIYDRESRLEVPF
jgi:hypothetical protein